MERCNHTSNYHTGIDFRIKTIEIDGKRVKLQIWLDNHYMYKTPILLSFPIKGYCWTGEIPYNCCLLLSRSNGKLSQVPIPFSSLHSGRVRISSLHHITSSSSCVRLPFFLLPYSHTYVPEVIFNTLQGILVVYDVTNRSSFENLSEWLDHIKTVSPACKHSLSAYRMQAFGSAHALNHMSINHPFHVHLNGLCLYIVRSTRH